MAQDRFDGTGPRFGFLSDASRGVYLHCPGWGYDIAFRVMSDTAMGPQTHVNYPCRDKRANRRARLRSRPLPDVKRYRAEVL